MTATQRITPCLWFDTQAEAAAAFYVSLFPNSSILSLSRYGPGRNLPEGLAMKVQFCLDGAQFQLMNGGPMYTLNEAASLTVNCTDQAEVDRLWAALTSEGGSEGRCGWLKDRFGVSWQIVPTDLPDYLGGADRAGAGRAMQAMLAMKKLDIDVIAAAYRGD